MNVSQDRPTGSKRERSPGHWQLSVYIGQDPTDPTGKKQRYRCRTFLGDARAADEALAVFVEECAKDKPSTLQTVSWLLDEYLRTLEAHGTAASTLTGYRNKVAIWIKPLVGSVQLHELNAGHLRSLQARMTDAGKSASTIRQVRAILQGALKLALHHGWVDRNVATVVEAPRIERAKVVAASPEESDALYRASGSPGDDLPTAIALATYTGRRLGELCALRWSNVDLKVGMSIRFVTTKTDAATDVPVMTVLAERLAERRAFQIERAQRVGCELDPDPYVLSFVADGSRKPASSSYGHAFGRVRDELGLPHLHFHCLRHGFATQALAAGVDPFTIALWLGHRDLSMVGKVYGHGTAGATQRAAVTIEAAFQLSNLVCGSALQ